MTITIYQADAFSDKLFGGNPAAICPLNEWLPEPLMQKIAAENNLAETAFFVYEGDGYKLRWFTPEMEIDLCGHATLATAHILYTELGYSEEKIRFHTIKAGTLVVTRHSDLYTLDFPTRIGEKVEAPSELIQALGRKTPLETFKSRDYMLIYDTEEEVASIKPDFIALSKIDALGIIVTAKGSNSDFVSRMFAPSAGINEDPVTGSAHCSLIPYWSKKLGKTQLHAYQISTRRGELWCELKEDRVLISGKVVTYLKGEIFV